MTPNDRRAAKHLTDRMHRLALATGQDPDAPYLIDPHDGRLYSVVERATGTTLAYRHSEDEAWAYLLRLAS